MKKKKIIIVVIVLAIVCAAAVWLFAYGPLAQKGVEETEETEEVEKVEPVGPAFNADSAYAFTKAQCDFGPRPMNSEAHEKCLQWIEKKFKQYGCEVELQKADLKGWDGTMLHSTNIIARYNPKATTRILLCAHWDSRPWADNDPDSLNHHKPILAANDAASGVAVMLELARLLNTQRQHNASPSDDSSLSPHDSSLSPLNSSLGIDFVCFDAEDYGVPEWSDVQDDGSSFALGAQYWAEHIPQGYAPRYGILLDMVGGAGAQFYREGMSVQYAPAIVKKVWRAARQAGYGSFFPNQDGGMITDDHIPVNQTAKIPCIDIIPYYPTCQQSSFGPTWHTLADNMDNIDKNVLKAVGQTMVQVLFTEK